jgi:site-specific recombinase XerD
MRKELTVITPQTVSIEPATDAARAYVAASKADNTRRAYRSDWAHFGAWCESHGLAALPALPQTVALYLADQASAGMKVSTLGRRLAAISKAHQASGLESPAAMRHAAVAEVWQGIRRTEGIAPAQKAAATTDTLRAMLRHLPAGLLGIRDRALLLLGFAGAFRRSELVGLTVADLAFGTDGLTVTLRRSKTDQAGAGRKVGIPYGGTPATCPVRAVQAWLEASSLTDGPLLRSVDRHGRMGASLSDRAVALTVKRYAAAAGLNAEQFAGHSLRAGLATSAAAAGVSERAIMQQTGHRSTAMVRRYIREASLFSNNAAAKVGL